ncbi:GNAT family N-acetyltransferase [Nonomuraea endophytica]|uniref:GNAT superfamily N-acetyltransferase n=1 Tax=Nonomuraea endophytica TaxID=714136 RepID=A0A7W7ZWY0_9ACTN|nr:GNAT family N-acetyltransferase [Nonomuraea endophytica]MBB5075322.1 GNAT superfamily N-acetyltransferase [Nonomuraea endophytica]
MTSEPDLTWKLRPAVPDDADPIAELRAIVLRPDLERLGLFDPTRVRQRFKTAFLPEHTSIVEVNGAFAGSIALRPAEDGVWLEHFYLSPTTQGRGVGTAILHKVLTDEGVFRLNVLRDSPAQRLYERHGFTTYAQDPTDLWMIRTASRN